MKLVIKEQPIASTKVDLHNESYDLEFIESLRRSIPSVVPLNIEHDLSKAPIGEMRDFKIIEKDDYHVLVCDVYSLDGTIPNYGGFSWSVTQLNKKQAINDDGFFGEVYLPWPIYNDDQLVNYLTVETGALIGKWIKKSASSSALLGLITFLLKPVWDDVYNNEIKGLISKLQDAPGDYDVEYAKIFKVPGNELEITLNSSFQSGPERNDALVMKGAVEKAQVYVDTLKKHGNIHMSRVYMNFDSEKKSYTISHGIDKDGNLIEY